MKRLRPRLTYANVIATLALFLALGGGAYAAIQLPKNSVGAKQLKKNAVTTAKIKDGAVTGSKIRLSSLGTVPNASHADSATSAGSAATASSLAPPEPLRVVGQPGEPGFGPGWANFISGSLASYYMDRQGIVHLQGDVTRGSGTNSTIFVLPAQYAPAHTQFFPAIGNGATFAVIGAETTGAVVLAGGDPGVLVLNGITWRAGQ